MLLTQQELKIIARAEKWQFDLSLNWHKSLLELLPIFEQQLTELIQQLKSIVSRNISLNSLNEDLTRCRSQLVRLNHTRQSLANEFHGLCQQLPEIFVQAPYAVQEYIKFYQGSVILTQKKLWETIRSDLAYYRSVCAIQSPHSHNQLANLIAETPVFLDAIDSGRLPLGEEMGHLAIARLHDIKDSHEKPFAGYASRLLRGLLGFSHSDNIYYFDHDALEREIIKLKLYAFQFPENKIAWIGTARAVNAMIREHPGQGAYFNPDSHHHTWALNRAWLHAAAAMNFEFLLVEQHYPSVENAILSNRPAELFAELVKEARDETHTSQYSGHQGPTATPQEMLVLLELGYRGKKNPDCSLQLFKPKRIHSIDHADDPPSPTKHVFKRTHTSPELFRAAPLPPLSDPHDHFRAPSPPRLTPRKLFSDE